MRDYLFNTAMGPSSFHTAGSNLLIDQLTPEQQLILNEKVRLLLAQKGMLKESNGGVGVVGAGSILRQRGIMNKNGTPAVFGLTTGSFK
jgi:hypothetical protein